MSRRRRKPLPKDPVQATIESLSHEGRGITHIQGKTTFIRGALPGETVSFTYNYCSSQYDEGTAIEILHPSEDRVEPKCKHTDFCGGCSLQHMQTSAQLAFKQQTLLDQFKHFGETQPDTILPALQAESFGYRRKARLGVRYVAAKQKVLVGFREKNGRYITDIEQCVVLHPKVGTKIHLIAELIRALSCFDQIPQIEVAMGDDDTALIFRHLVAFTDQDLEKLTQFGASHQIQIYLQPNKPNPIQCIWPTPATRELHYTLSEQKLALSFHPTQFTQVNYPINRMMVNQALDLLNINSEDVILDLFCGIGNFTLPLATKAKKVVGVELSDTAIEQAKRNAALNNLSNTAFYCHNLFEDCSQQSWAQTSYDKALIDPPRSGAKPILALVATLEVQHIVYISCNPATLARDAGILVHEHHYRLTSAGIMNMFPHTNHIESIAVFSKI